MTISRSEAEVSEPVSPPNEPVLVVDLDGTLSRTDTLHEALLAMAAHRPWRLPRAFAALRDGKAAFKAAVADAQIIPGRNLVYDEHVLALVRDARARGRRTALVSAADQRQVTEVASHLDLFDDAIGTGGDAGSANLGGRAKADFLIARYGAQGFDYVGDAKTDLPVWAAARRAITAGASPRLRTAAESVTATEALHLERPTQSRGRALLKALRPHQWSKNLLVFLPMMAAHDASAFPAAFIAFLAFSLTASSVYLINDLVDLSADRAHERKRLRPFAAGTLPLAMGLAVAPILALAALTMALLWTPPSFLVVLLAYYVATFAYSFWLKRKALVDVLTLAGLYTSRIVAGAAATALTLSPWMLSFSMFLFLALAAVKRQAELAGQDPGRKAAGRGYETADLPLLREIALASGFASIVVFALYISSDAVRVLYTRPEGLWLICPLLLYWITRMALMTHRGFMTDDPIVFAARDRTSWGVVLACIVIAAVAGFWP